MTANHAQMLLPILAIVVIFEIVITATLTEQLGEKVLILLHLIITPLLVLNVIDIDQNGPIAIRVGVSSG